MPVSPLTNSSRELAEIIRDYRAGEAPAMDVDHVRRWVRQFPEGRRLAILREMTHLFEYTYFAKSAVRRYLASLIDCEDLLDGERPARFWKKVNFLRLQKAGSSQVEMLKIFGGVLKKRFGYGTLSCGSKDGPYFYLDDFIFTGRRLRSDALEWLSAYKGPPPNLHVAMVGVNSYGRYYAGKAISEAIEARKGTLTIYRAEVLEDRKKAPASCDVLRPRRVYGDPAVEAYVSSLEYDVALRADKTTSKLYATESGRRVLEHQLLLAGLKIRSWCANPVAALRPLGFQSLESFGCGAVFATYRNCPNTCPLAWWWGDPDAPRSNPLSKWYPLLPRKL